MSEEKLVEKTNTVLPAESGTIGAEVGGDKPAPSRRDSVVEAFEKVEKAKEKPITAPPVGKLAQAPPSTPITPAVGERPRDPKTGQFLSGEQAPTIKRRDMPRAWKQDYKPKWETLDPEIANFLAELEETREKQVLSGIDQYKQAAAWASPLRQILQPYEQTFQQQYGGLAQGVQQLLQLSTFAANKPKEFLEWFARSRGIDFGSQQPQDPQTQTLMQSLQPMLQPVLEKVTGLERQLQQFSTSQSQASESQALNVVNEFLDQKDESGSLKFPITDDVIDDFAARIAFVRGAHSDWDDQRVLEQAYDDLGWTHPAMRQSRLDREASQRRVKDEAELQAKKAAAVSVTGAPATTQTASIDPRDRRKAIEAAFDRVTR